MEKIPTIGILRPGKIGDIIICLPIAKHYFNNSYRVIWPIHESLYNMFNAVAGHYVTFIPIQSYNWADCTRKCIERLRCINKKIDLLYTFDGYWGSENTRKFQQNNTPFDQFNYELANVPFDKKWKLDIKRNKDREVDLYNKLVKQEKYAVVHFTGSISQRRINLENDGSYQIIEITPCTNNIFDWLTIIEKSKKLILLDSCFANLVEQLNLDNKKYFLKRSEYKATPTLRNKWTII
jgi:hypothetical protein